MKNHLILLILLIWSTSKLSFAQNDSTIQILPISPEVATIALNQYKLSADDKGLIFKVPESSGTSNISINGEEKTLTFVDNTARVDLDVDEKGQLHLIKADSGFKLYHLAKRRGTVRLKHIPLWLSILPPLIAIVLALIFKEVILSLFVGTWMGAFIAGGMRFDSIYYFLQSIMNVIDTYILNALNDSGHLSVIIFSLLIGGMVGIISRNGGMAGIVVRLSKYAKTAQSAQLVTWILGVAIFFDDYANTLIVGNTIRSVTDKYKVSREKLAYIVDSTAAPVAAVAFITTWIGAELGYIDDGIKLLTNFDLNVTPYAIFISSLKYSFYPLFTLCFILLLIYFQKDYGPMHKAELRARTTGEVSPPTSSKKEIEELEDLSPVKGAIPKSYNAFLPVLTVILVTIFGLLDTGMASTYGELVDAGVNLPTESWAGVWKNIPLVLGDEGSGFFLKIGKLIGNADSYVALLWASLSGVILALLLTVSQKIMSLSDTATVMVTGFKTIMPAIVILTMAWSLAGTTESLHTATYLSSTLEGRLNPFLMPPIIFVLAALISFSTGSSWSTMAILYPIAIPTTWAICMAQGLETDVSYELLLNVISTVLAASVMGDHCSPISDTTILSSLASDCNHIDHVRTQLPYALTVGSVSIIMGTLSTFLGGGWLVSFILFAIGMGILFGVVWRFGKKV